MGTSDRPIFIVGCPRSGTTLLQVMLHSHRRIAIPPETRFLIALYQQRAGFGDLAIEDNRRELATFMIKRGSKFRDLGLDGRQVTREIVNGPPTIGSAAGIVYRAYARRFDKERWGDKRPGYFSYIPELLSMFPDAQLIHLVRDGRDCVASLKRMPWWEHDSVTSMCVWAQAVDYSRRAGRQVGPQRYIELQYERLVADPEPELRRLCSFLKEDFDPGMLAPHLVAGSAVPERKGWHSRTRGAVDTTAIGGWREQLEEWEISLMEQVCGRQLRRYGYPITGLSGRPPAAALVRYARVNAKRRLAVTKRRLRDRRVQRDYRQPVAARLTRGQLERA